jgi:peptidoglycan/xylan/chitin deacetylase (PgdA/CDA1 family)
VKHNPALDGMRAVAVLAVLGLGAAYAWASYGPKTAVLTFDDGPQDARTDAAILAVLRKHHAPAVWFVNCKWLATPENRATLRQIAAEGVPVGNHGYDHLPLLTLTPAQLDHEIGGCSEAIQAATGKAPAYFRPPWGKSSPEVRARLGGMREMLWSADSMDHAAHFFRQKPDAYRAYLRDNPTLDVALTARSGDVILFHDYANTAATLDDTLTRLERRGFRFTPPQAVTTAAAPQTSVPSAREPTAERRSADQR